MLVATSDHEEVVQLADCALVMVRGRIVRELDGDQITAVSSSLPREGCPEPAGGGDRGGRTG